MIGAWCSVNVSTRRVRVSVGSLGSSLTSCRTWTPGWPPNRGSRAREVDPERPEDRLVADAEPGGVLEVRHVERVGGGEADVAEVEEGSAAELTGEGEAQLDGSVDEPGAADRHVLDRARARGGTALVQGAGGYHRRELPVVVAAHEVRAAAREARQDGTSPTSAPPSAFTIPTRARPARTKPSGRLAKARASGRRRRYDEPLPAKLKPSCTAKPRNTPFVVLRGSSRKSKAMRCSR